MQLVFSPSPAMQQQGVRMARTGSLTLVPMAKGWVRLSPTWRGAASYASQSGLNPDQAGTHTYTPISPFQRVALAIGSAFAALRDPTRDDMIAVLGETTGTLALSLMRRRMLADPVGREILATRPRISSATVDVDALRGLPDDTFGSAYVRFLDKNGISPDTRRQVRFVEDAELAYVLQRYREIHDFVHTVLGLDEITVHAEIAVKWVEMMQTGLPVAALSAFVGPVGLSVAERRVLCERYLPWAVDVGREAHFLLNVRYEDHFGEPIDALRARLRIRSPCPK